MIDFAALLAIGSALLYNAQSGCGAIDGAERLLDETEGRVLLIGELHGTRETPAFVASLACLALNRDESVVVALEMSAEEQERLDAFLASDGGAEAQAALLDSAAFWRSGFQDGRRSEAVLRLIEAARIWRRIGEPIELLAMDASSDDDDLPEENRRDAAMLRRLMAAREQADRVIALTGNVHARELPARFGGRRVETIGSLAPEDVIASVNSEYALGESWNCRAGEGGEPHCGVHASGSRNHSGDPRVYFDSDAEEFSSEAYDYIVYLGPATASPPAIERTGEPD